MKRELKGDPLGKGRAGEGESESHEERIESALHPRAHGALPDLLNLMKRELKDPRARCSSSSLWLGSESHEERIESSTCTLALRTALLGIS